MTRRLRWLVMAGASLAGSALSAYEAAELPAVPRTMVDSVGIFWLLGNGRAFGLGALALLLALFGGFAMIRAFSSSDADPQRTTETH